MCVCGGEGRGGEGCMCVKLRALAQMNWKKTAPRSRDLPTLKFVSKKVITVEVMDNKANLAEFIPQHTYLFSPQVIPQSVFYLASQPS